MTPSRWLCSVGRAVVPEHSETFHCLRSRNFATTAPSCSDVRVQLRVHRPDALPERILYWAASPRRIEDSRISCSAECAYDRYANMGVACRNADLVYEIDLRCPQAYVADDPKTHTALMWSRHLHFVAVTTETPDPAGDATTESRRRTVDVHTNDVHPLLLLPGTHAHPDKLQYTCTPLLDPRRHAGPSMFVGAVAYWTAKAHGVVCINALPHDDPSISHTDLAVAPDDTHLQAHVLDAVKHAMTHHRAMPQAPHAPCRLRGCATTKTRKARHLRNKPRPKRKPTARSPYFTQLMKRWPLLVYCKHAQCMAAKRLFVALHLLGFHNIYYMLHGSDEMRDMMSEVNPSWWDRSLAHKHKKTER